MHKTYVLNGASIVAGEKLSKKEQKQLSQFERNAMEEYMRSKLTLEKDKTDKKIQTTDKRYSSHRII